MKIECRSIAKSLFEDLHIQISQLNFDVRLDVVLVGDNYSSEIYVRNKEKRAREVGMKFNVHRHSDDVLEKDLLNCIASLNTNPSVDGIIVQMPLPKHINPNNIICAINPLKDVDGFHPLNIGYLNTSISDCLIPCTAQACLHIIEKYAQPRSHVAIVNRSNIVGKPLAALLLRKHYTTTILHSQSNNIKDITKSADVVVVAIGRPNFFDKSYFNQNSIVIDVGMTRSTDNSKWIGDAAFDSVYGFVRGITTVPGGVGQLTVYYILKNTMISAIRKNTI